MIMPVISCHKLLKFILLISFSILISKDGYCQIISNPQKANENIYLVRTKQFNEFLDRFNYKTDFNGKKIDSVFMSKMPRQKLLYSLFDLKDPRILAGEKHSDSYENTKARFIAEITGNNILINKYSGNILAEAKSRILFNDVPHTISLFLNQEHVGNNMVKWVILDVRGDIFNFLKADTSFKRYLSPSNNEIDFIDLKRAMEDINYLHYYASGGFNMDLLSVFFYCVNKKMIKFEYVQEVKYHILDVSGWCIKVREFNRLEMNSGWLIYDITANNLNLKDYLKILP
jgi:hypothetical protein